MRFPPEFQPMHGTYLGEDGVGETVSYTHLIACDFSSKAETLAFLDQFSGRKPYVKIGMELFYAEGPSIVREIKARGHQIFLDLKLLSLIHIFPRCGGDAMTAAMERRINDFLAQRGCPARLIKEYGMSEVAGIVCVSYGNWEAGDVGRPLPGCRIIAVDPETGAVCPPEVQGELIIPVSYTHLNVVGMIRDFP